MIKEKLKKYSIVRKLFRIVQNRSNRSKLLHENGYELICKIDELMNSIEIDYFADFGTLLGLIREGELISYDLDLDFGIINANKLDKKRIRDVFEKNGIKRIEWFTVDNDVKEETYRYNDSTFDIFYYEFNNKQCWCYIFCKIDSTNYNNQNDYTCGIYKYDMIITTESISLHNIKTKIPKNAEILLEMKYGTNWRIPNKYWHYWYDADVTVLDKIGKVYHD